MNIILLSVALLGGIGIISSVILYITAKKFKVKEDLRIGQIEDILPGANCGGCGCNGCHDFACACTKATSLEGLNCPSSGAEVMEQIAGIVGLKAVKTVPQVAVVRCGGSCDKRPQTSIYDGPQSCEMLHTLYIGSTDCAYGCLGEGDCVAHCSFGGIKMNEKTGLPEVDESVCVGCGSCVDACPRGLIELRNKGPRGLRVYVGCRNKDWGAIAIKECKSTCIGCGKCLKVCPHDAITIENNLAYIDYRKCKLCRKCEAVCPTHAIKAVNFPVRKDTAGTFETKTVEK